MLYFASSMSGSALVRLVNFIRGSRSYRRYISSQLRTAPTKFYKYR